MSLFVPDADRCRAQHARTGWTCSFHKEHSGPHRAHDMHDLDGPIIAAMGDWIKEEEAPVAPAPKEVTVSIDLVLDASFDYLQLRDDLLLAVLGYDCSDPDTGDVIKARDAVVDVLISHGLVEMETRDTSRIVSLTPPPSMGAGDFFHLGDAS